MEKIENQICSFFSKPFKNKSSLKSTEDLTPKPILVETEARCKRVDAWVASSSTETETIGIAGIEELSVLRPNGCESG